MAKHRPTAIFLFSNEYQEDKFLPIITYLTKIPEIKFLKCFKGCSKTERSEIINKIKEEKVEKLILAGESPGFYKDYITIELERLGLKPEIIIFDFYDYWYGNGLNNNKIIAAITGEVYNIPYKKLIGNGSLKVNEQTLVIGGGIAGIQASLEIANAGKKVYLVEKTATIGGHMAMFDKTFPTLDCAACILTPKMVDVGQHSDIELITCAEIKNVEGVAGNFKVKILKHARKVDLNKCIGCGSCSARCPSQTQSEFDSGISMRKAIYIPFPQAVPNKYVVDATICRYEKDPYEINSQTIKELHKTDIPKEVIEKIAELKGAKFNSEDEFKSRLISLTGEQDATSYMETINKLSGACRNCVRFCPVNDCINLAERDEEAEIEVGNIIVATGFKPFDAKKAVQYGYGKYQNVLTSLELERLINAAGPTEGKITMAETDKKGNRIFNKEGVVPKSVAIVHCIGSRDVNHNKYCSKVCCMYSLKLAHLVREKLSYSSVYEYFIDMRAYGKGYEEFYERIKKEGVHIVRGKTAKVEQTNGQLKIRGENILKDELIEQNVDMLILSVGLEPVSDAVSISRILGISVTEEGWFRERISELDSVTTDSQGIYIAGVCQGPKDIPDTVAQASAAAVKVLSSILRGKIEAERDNLTTDDIDKKLKELVS